MLRTCRKMRESMFFFILDFLTVWNSKHTINIHRTELNTASWIRSNLFFSNYRYLIPLNCLKQTLLLKLHLNLSINSLIFCCGKILLAYFVLHLSMYTSLWFYAFCFNSMASIARFVCALQINQSTKKSIYIGAEPGIFAWGLSYMVQINYKPFAHVHTSNARVSHNS